MSHKTQFIESELWILAWNASVQRSNLYKKGASDADKISFRKYVIEHIRQRVIPEYREAVSERKHLKNIGEIVRIASHHGKSVLASGYKYGVAQKLLNLGLKYYWCRGKIAEPPHCPVDRLILDKTHLKGRFNWTEMTDEKDYLEAIAAIRSVAQNSGKSLAIFELEVYNRRS